MQNRFAFGAILCRVSNFFVKFDQGAWNASAFHHASVKLWWAWEDSNLRPYAYQAYALTTWATSPRRRKVRFVPFPAKAENFTHFLAPPLHSKPASLGFEMILAFLDVGFLCPSPLVEMRRIELLTPCLQGRCSPSWATPPFLSEEFGRRSEEFSTLFLLLCSLRIFGRAEDNSSHFPLFEGPSSLRRLTPSKLNNDLLCANSDWP